MMFVAIMLAAIMLAAIMPGVTALQAQWLNYPTPGIPRLPDGKPNLAAPSPKTLDGKPDLSGIWLTHGGYTGNIAKDLKPGEFLSSLGLKRCTSIGSIRKVKTILKPTACCRACRGSTWCRILSKSSTPTA
jgi:hypothetical protein